MRRLILCLIVVFTLLRFDTYAYDKYTTSKITSIEGLSQNDVSDIIQDSYGFMWIATSDGLCRYDGYEFLIYSIGDYGLKTNLISSVVEDHNGNIWVGTVDKGVYCYLRSRNHFYHYSELIDRQTITPLRGVRQLTLAPDGTIWGYDIAAQAIVHINFDSVRDRIGGIDLYPREEKGIQVVSSIYATSSEVYFGTYNGLYVYNPDNNNFVEVKTSSSLGSIYYMVARGELLHLSTQDGFVTLNIRTGRVTNHDLGIWVSKFLWQGDTMWIASGSGVYTCKYNSVHDSFSGLEVVDTFSNYYVNDISEDHTGGIWVGLYQAGIRRYEANKKPFMINQGFGNDQVLSIFQAPLGDLWVSTNRGGIFILDSIDCKAGRRGILPQQTIYSMDYAAVNSTIYVATSRNLLKIKEEDGVYLDPEVSLQNSYVRKVLVDSAYLWVSLNNRGVVRHNLIDESYVNITQNSHQQLHMVRNMMQDRMGNIWLCANNGVAKIPSDERLKSSPQIEMILPDLEDNRYAVSIVEDHNGSIWYGTLGYGLYSLRERSAEEQISEGGGKYFVRHITTKDGLASNVIKAIQEDGNGVIWVSTNRGLSSVVVVDDKVKINNYNIHNGLQAYEFNELSAAKLPDGTLVFGGVAGYNYFNPNNFIVDTTQIRPVVTDFILDGESILNGDVVLDVAPDGLYGDRGLVLNHDQNSFTIKFAGLHYSDPSKNKYRYRLEGEDRKWINSSAGVREVSYRNLMPGDYVFYLNAANADGVWASEPLAIDITICYPFWMTWYAFLFYTILLVVGAFYATRQVRYEMKRRNAIALADMEKRKMEEMLNMRTRFFTNVSHEFRTPLTLILTPLQRLMADEQIAANPKWRALLNTMVHNGDSLMRLINEFLSYTKHESGGLKVQLSVGDFTILTQSLFDQFKFWAEQRGITLHYTAPQRAVMMCYDQHLIEQVIYNLTSNAIKFTPEGGHISLLIDEYYDHIIFSIEDTGCGITEQMRPYVFERFYSRINDDSKEIGGTGIGLFLTKSLVLLHGGEIWFNTEVDKGTTFFVKLPKGVDHNEVAEDDTIDTAVSIQSYEHEHDESNESEESVPPSTLLVVDDNVEILHLLSEIFEEQYTIITAKNGEEGWQKAFEQLPDIIISDVMMPKMNGLDLCDKIKSDTTTSHIPVILLSAKASNEDIATGLRYSADAYCPKPFNYEVLMSTVNSILTNRRRLADKYSVMSVNDSGHSPLLGGDDDAMTNTDKFFLGRLVEYIETNIHNPNLVVSDLCNYMGITPLVLNKKLKSLVNMTANSLIRTIRLRRAAALLKTARYTVADVTYDVGFSDLRYFRECFKKEFGLLPQEYKDQSSGGDSVIDSKALNSIGDAIIDAAATKYTRTKSERGKRED